MLKRSLQNPYRLPVLPRVVPTGKRLSVAQLGREFGPTEVLVNEPYPADTWKGIKGEFERGSPPEKVEEESQQGVVEIGDELLVTKQGSRDLSLMMAVPLKGEDVPWLACVSDNPQLAFRRFGGRHEARNSRDWLTLRIRSNAETVLYAGIRTESGKQVIPFKPSEFDIEFALPSFSEMHGKKHKTKSPVPSKAVRSFKGGVKIWKRNPKHFRY